MSKLLELKSQCDHKALSAQDILERADKDNRPLHPDELQLFDKLKVEIEELNKSIAAETATDQRRTQLQETLDNLNASPGRQTVPVQPSQTINAAAVPFRIPASARRSGHLKAFKGPNADEQAYRAGMWARAVIFRSDRAAHWCQNHNVGNIRNAMGGNSNPDGGYLVADELSQAIIDLREEYGVFRRECRVWPMGGDTLMIPRRTGGITIGLIGENPSSAISQSTPTFDQVQLVAKKFGGLSLLSSEIAEDAVIDLADWIAGEFAYAFATFEDTAGFAGDGTSTYGGIRGLTNLFTEATALAGGLLATAGDDTFAEIIAEDLSSLMGKLPAYARPNAKWYCSATCADIVFGRIAALAGGNTTQTLRDGLGFSYLGYPIVISQALPSATTSFTDGNPMLFFGDLSKSSALGDRRMVKVFPSEHRYMDTDQIGIRGVERIDIVNHDVGTASVVGPIVALLANAS